LFQALPAHLFDTTLQSPQKEIPMHYIIVAYISHLLHIVVMSKVEFEELKHRVSLLEDMMKDMKHTTVHKCEPTQPLKVSKPDQDWTFTSIIVGWACSCGKHLACNHICEMYQCRKPVACGVEFCDKCLALKAEQAKLDAKKAKCIRCHFGGAPAQASYGGEFCSSHCQMMCALYDK
jgi:hypothetical protein